MEEDRGLMVGILDTLVVAQDKRARLGGKLDSPGELLGQWERGPEERQHW